MPRREVERRVQQSVLDRLLDPKGAPDRQLTWGESIQQYKEAVRRDLEWLLNTRRIPELAPEAYSELQRSLYHYGLPDITSLSADSPETRKRLVRHIEEAIQLFEPRIKGVRVEVVESDDDSIRDLRFLIEGLLQMEPDPERVTFDTVLDATSGSFDVR